MTKSKLTLKKILKIDSFPMSTTKIQDFMQTLKTVTRLHNTVFTKEKLIKNIIDMLFH